MGKEELEERFVGYLTRKMKRDGRLYGKSYLKDKLARLRRLQKILPISKLGNITDENYFELTDKVMKKLNQPIGSIGRNYKYGDCMVVMRLLYEMNNAGKQGKRYVYYGGVKVPNAR